MLRKRFTRLAQIYTGTHSGQGDELVHLEGRMERFVHFWMLAWRHFVNNRCLVRAEALAYTTLLALIPLLAVAVAITGILLKSQGEDKIYQAIDKFVSNVMPPAAITNHVQVAIAETNGVWPAISGTTPSSANTNFSVAGTNLTLTAGTNITIITVTTNSSEDARVVLAQKEAAKNIHDYIQNAQSSKLGVTGMVVFIFIAIAMLRRVEETFNDIWGVTQGRRWWRQTSNYFTIIALGPVMLVVGTSLASGHYLHLSNYLAQKLPFMGNVIMHGLLPLMVLWITFALFYMLVPNTRVKFSAAMIGGLIAGTLWHLNNVFAFFYISRVITNSAIYGKLGLVPVFMLGLYLSWLILLFGAQIAYVYQNRAAYLQDKIADNVNQRGREFIALRIMTLLGQRFQNSLPPAPVDELSDELGVPSRLAHRILRQLAAARLVVEASGDENAYVPARPLETINAHQILMALRCGSGRELVMNDSADLVNLYGDFARIEAAEKSASEKITVLTLVQHQPAQLTIETPKSSAAGNDVAAPSATITIEPELSEPETPKASEPAHKLAILEKAEAKEAVPPAKSSSHEDVSAKVKPEKNVTGPPVSEKAQRPSALPEEREFPL